MAEKDARKFNWKIAGALGWLLFTLTMAGWWLYLGLSFLGQLEGYEASVHETITRQKNMMIWEGMAWMILLLGGGLTLIYLIARERIQTQKLRLFLATFSHDVKTALTSLRLQTDIIREDAGDLPAIRRLESDVVRLELQLENSLFLASEKRLQLFIESLSLAKIITSLRESWPSLTIELNQEAILRADRRAIESIFGNLLQNARNHGRAKHVYIKVKRRDANLLEIEIADDGKGFKGEIESLGKLFERHNPSSGSGVGLYSSVTLVQQMNGHMSFSHSAQGGFLVRLSLPGGLP